MGFEKLNSKMGAFLNPTQQEAPKYDDDKMWEYCESAQISFDSPINKPPAIMSISNGGKAIPIFTKGNFSLFKGQAKSRKTFGLSMIAASLAFNMRIYDTFIPNMPGKVTLFIDTEQSDYHVFRFVNSVVNISDHGCQANTFRALCLRPYETAMRLKIVEFLIYNVTNLGYVIIDGIRDLITDINSQEEAKMMSDKLMKWTKEKNIHISCVLHENPGNGESGKARGHIGTELTNKAETVIRFEKNKVEPRQSIMSSSDTRGEEFEPIYFEIDENSMGLFPVIIPHNQYISKKQADRF